MSKAAPLQSSFNGGELSAYVSGRPDVAKYVSGCETMSGYLPLVEGPAITRPGTLYVAETKTSADRSWLIRFEFSASDSYMLEFGDEYIRFYTNRGQVLSAGVPYEVVSPYAVGDLTDADGALALRFVQTGDVVYIVHADYPPYKLSRLAPTNWTMTAVDFNPPPFEAENITATTIYANAATGSVTLTASASTFTSAHVGQYILLREKDVRDVEQWEAAKAVVLGDTRRSDGKNYEALNGATTGSVKPTHASGAAYDGDGAVQWQYLDPGYGWAKITGYTNATTVTATVVSRIPAGAVGSGNATTRWALQAWNADDGYPNAITFFRERLTLARDSTVWFSVAGDFENFAAEIDGVITADAGFERTLASDRVNEIRWLSPGDVLLVGTLGDEWAITESTTTDPFGPDNCKTKRQSTYGSNTVAPQRVGNETLFIQRAGKKVRAMSFQFTEDGFESPNVTAYNRTISGPGIIDIAYQQEPWSVLWCVRSDGLLVGLTIDREQDVVAWHRHPFSGGTVECAECIPAPDGSHDDLWLQVKYTIDGATKRYIAHMATWDDDTDQEDWVYSDMAATYSGAAATTISGLDYLEGEEVWVLVNGARHPNRTVSGGEIELQEAGTVVTVGLPSPAQLTTMNFDGGNPTGTSQGKTKRAHLMTLRVYKSLGGRAGPSATETEEIRYRPQTTVLGSPPAAFTGDVNIEWPGDYSTSMQVTILKDRPMPQTIVALMPQMQVESGR